MAATGQLPRRWLRIALCGTVAVSLYNLRCFAAENLALDKKYLFSHHANYRHCTGTSDATDLTDGKKIIWGSGPQPWVKQDCVGWQLGGGATRSVRIELDRVEPIDSVVVSAHFGYGASAYLPKRVLISVSDDGETYHKLAVCRLDVDQRKRGNGNYEYSAGNLRTRGRYVLIQLQADGPFIFCDEIEVFAAAHDPAGVRFAPDSRFAFEQQLGAVGLSKGSPLYDRQQKELANRSRYLLGLIRKLESFHVHDSQTVSQLGPLRAEVGPQTEVEPYQAIFNELSNVSIAAKQRRFAGQKACLWWTAASKTTSPFDEPAEKGTDLKSSLRLASNEVAPVALMVTNTSARDIELRVRLDGEPSIRQGVKVRLAWFHQYNEKNPEYMDSNPLPLMEAMEGPVRVGPGRVQQLWLECDARAMTSGEHIVKIHVADGSDEIGTAELHLTVDETHLPKSEIKSYCFDYLMTWRMLRGKLEVAQKDLAEHGVTHLVFHPSELPRGKFDEQGRPVEEMDFSALDRRLKSANKEMVLVLFMNYSSSSKRLLAPGFKLGSDPWKRAFKTWLNGLTGRLEQAGWPKQKFMLFPFDEVSPNEARMEGVMARYVKSLDERYRLFETAYGNILGTIAQKEVTDTIHLPIAWVVKRTHLADVRAEFAGAAEGLGSYSVTGQSTASRDSDGNLTADPYDKFRLYWWRALKYELRGIGFWCYACTGYTDGDAWYQNGPDSTVVFGDEGAPFKTTEPLIPSKKWEAWRQGWIDTRYVKYVRCLAKAKRHPENLADIEQLIEWVLADSADVTRADQARKRMQTWIDNLNGT